MPSIRKKLAGKTSKLALPRERLEDHPADPREYREGEFCMVELGLINADPNQPRKYFDPESLAELSQSIGQKGVLQPIIIRRETNGGIYLVAGERRYRAAKMAGLEKIPAVLTRGNPMEIALIENLQRDNLRPVEEAEALGRMVEEYKYTHEQLSLVIGKARSTITEALSLNRLPEEIKEECRRADMYPRRLLIEVAKQKTSARMRSLFKKIKSAGLKSGQVRDITRNKRKSDRSVPVSTVLQRISALDKTLQNFEINSAQPDEISRVLDALQALSERIANMLK